jgi:hypothetical protein
MHHSADERSGQIASAHGLEDPAARDFARQVLDHMSDWYARATTTSANRTS